MQKKLDYKKAYDYYFSIDFDEEGKADALYKMDIMEVAYYKTLSKDEEIQACDKIEIMEIAYDKLWSDKPKNKEEFEKEKSDYKKAYEDYFGIPYEE